MNPGHVQAHYELGTAWFRKGEIDHAIREWQEVLALAPTFFRAHYSLALAMSDTGGARTPSASPGRARHRAEPG